MISVIALVLTFADGYVGGHTTAKYYYDKAACERDGPKYAAQFTGYGHPTSFYCVPSSIPEANARIISK